MVTATATVPRTIDAALTGGAAPRPGVGETVQHMAGMLWYQMLQAMNRNGLSKDALGTGSDDFQNMFLWNLAQNDFSKYDTGLIAAAMRQVGGHEADIPKAANVQPSLPLARILPSASAYETAAPDALPDAAAASGDLLSQAKNFAAAIWPQISRAAQLLGVPPVAVLAQTALETGWGASVPGHNLFGIKALDSQPGSTRATHEVMDGVLTAQSARFRDYGTLADAVDDYVGLIQSGYQNAAGQGTVAGFAQALQQGGYATDQNYAAKIINLAHSPLMAQVLHAISGSSPQAGTPAADTGAP